MNAMQAFTPKYLKAQDLNGQAHLVHIERVYTRNDVLDPASQTEVTRHILFLHNGPKGIMLNLTQTMDVITATGEDDTDNWVGKSLILQPISNQVGMPTIKVIAFDPADKTAYAEFATRPTPTMLTGRQVQSLRSPAYIPPTPPAHVGTRATPPVAAPAPRRPRRQQAAAAAAAD